MIDSLSKSLASKLLLLGFVFFCVINSSLIILGFSMLLVAINALWVLLMLILFLLRQQKVVQESFRIQLLKEFQQSEAKTYLNQRISTPIPYYSRGWAASPDLIVELVKLIEKHNPRHIVELGAGISTVYLAAFCKQYNLNVKITSIEHDAVFAKACTQRLVDLNLTDNAQIIHAPLENWSDEIYSGNWYHNNQISQLTDIDILLVDGPISSNTNKLVRYPALPALKHKLSPKAIVVMDDYMREGEKTIVKHWKSMLDSEILTIEELYLEKEAAIVYLR